MNLESGLDTNNKTSVMNETEYLAGQMSAHFQRSSIQMIAKRIGEPASGSMN